MQKNKAFTIIELLVVISIISMLASVILVNTASVRASGRDAVRTQQIHQMDLAVRLYTEANGKAPLYTLCDIQSQNPTQAEASACFAVSTGGATWDAFKADIAPYMPQTPGDPCPSGCASPSGFPLGYAYGAPRAMQYYCSTLGNSCSASSRSYQIYTPLERSPNLVGTKDVGDFFVPSSAVPVINQFTFHSVMGNPGSWTFSWVSSNTSSCSIWDANGIIPPSVNPRSATGSLLDGYPINFGTNRVTLSCSGLGGTVSRTIP